MFEDKTLGNKFKLIGGDCLEVMRRIERDSIDAVVTDPPAGISFMGKAWDDDKGGRKEWIKWMTSVMQECLRVMKPGAHGLVWAIPRTSHWTATALEDAGFEIRDVVTHLFGSGFPKSMDISKAIDKAAGAERKVVGDNPYNARRANGATKDRSTDIARTIGPTGITAPATDAAKQWQGWGTALKPASEHWILVRKPISEKTVAANVLKYGTGAINIDASRIEAADQAALSKNWDRTTLTDIRGGNYNNGTASGVENKITAPTGRFPANLVLSCSDTCTEDAHDMFECPIAKLDEQSGNLGKSAGGNSKNVANKIYGKYAAEADKKPCGFGDSGGASRFFYCAKASKSDKGASNTHPTVKSSKLMSYLIRMITPSNGVVLDPFMGSGSTGVAAIKEGFKFVGIEREPEYKAIAEKRIQHSESAT